MNLPPKAGKSGLVAYEILKYLEEIDPDIADLIQERKRFLDQYFSELNLLFDEGFVITDKKESK